MSYSYFQCGRCQSVYADHECQCPETGIELCQHCYASFGESAAYEMHRIGLSRLVFATRCKERKGWWNVYELDLDKPDSTIKFWGAYKTRRGAEEVVRVRRKLFVRPLATSEVAR